MKNITVNVIGGGLAGSEASYQLLKRGYTVKLYEMRGVKSTPCHKSDKLAELVCSNSLKSENLDTASGMLKAEMLELDSLLLRVALRSRVPAGGALAVDRDVFSDMVMNELFAFENFQLIRQEIADIDTSIPTIIASGPLTSNSLSEAIARLIGCDYLYFFDAQAPIISGDSIDMTKAFFAARYDKGDSDYINCAFNKEEYLAFWTALVSAERAVLKDFETNIFEGCIPIEIMAARGVDTMRFGPLRPVGIKTPSGERPYAIVQLRKENIAGTAYNIVGFQTNLTFKEQKRVFAMIPGLENLDILRYGVMHRNTFINSPKTLNCYGQMKEHSSIFFAGQIAGVEGYMESIASGQVAAINLDLQLCGKEKMLFPSSTIIGQLQRHLERDVIDFQPMNANFGILPPLDVPSRDKKLRKMQYSERGIKELKEFIIENSL